MGMKIKFPPPGTCKLLLVHTDPPKIVIVSFAQLTWSIFRMAFFYSFVCCGGISTELKKRSLLIFL